ncbi:MAG: FtsX-like permease family protein, partial [Bacteroidota bacterium]
SGLYPALFLSSVRLTTALKGEQAVSTKKWNFRSILVSFQYFVTISLIFSIVIVEGQLQFIRNSDPGYKRDHIVRMNLPRDFNKETFKNDLLTNPNVLKASYSSRIPTGRLNDNWGTRYFQGDSLVESDFRLSVVSVDPDFLDTYEIDLISGKNFNESMLTVLDFDTIVNSHYIINETAAKAFGHQDPAEIVGEKIEYGVTEGRVIGVVEDFHFESLHQEIEPILLIYQDNFRGISLKIHPSNVQESLNYIEETFTKYESVTRPEYNFVDELFERQYLKEEISSDLIKVFAAIAILISCLGLIGMVGFVIETKMKEIGVRKVLGASTSAIWKIIGNRFFVLILIASIIALPIMYFLMTEWLNGFQYRIDISFFNVFAPVLIIFLITILTISYQLIKASNVNPVECLKDE